MIIIITIIRIIIQLIIIMIIIIILASRSALESFAGNVMGITIIKIVVIILE